MINYPQSVKEKRHAQPEKIPYFISRVKKARVPNT